MTVRVLTFMQRSSLWNSAARAHVTASSVSVFSQRTTTRDISPAAGSRIMAKSTSPGSAVSVTANTGTPRFTICRRDKSRNCRWCGVTLLNPSPSSPLSSRGGGWIVLSVYLRSVIRQLLNLVPTSSSQLALQVVAEIKSIPRDVGDAVDGALLGDLSSRQPLCRELTIWIGVGHMSRHHFCVGMWPFCSVCASNNANAISRFSAALRARLARCAGKALLSAAAAQQFGTLCHDFRS